MNFLKLSNFTVEKPFWLHRELNEHAEVLNAVV